MAWHGTVRCGAQSVSACACTKLVTEANERSRGPTLIRQKQGRVELSLARVGFHDNAKKTWSLV